MWTKILTFISKSQLFLIQNNPNDFYILVNNYGSAFFKIDEKIIILSDLKQKLLRF